MSYPLQILASAEIEISEAFNFYEGKVIGLGRRFLDSVDRSFSIISKSPEIYATKNNSFRACPLKNFPFLIFYAIEKECIVIYSIFNTSQDPVNWP